MQRELGKRRAAPDGAKKEALAELLLAAIMQEHAALTSGGATQRQPEGVEAAAATAADRAAPAPNRGRARTAGRTAAANGVEAGERSEQQQHKQPFEAAESPPLPPQQQQQKEQQQQQQQEQPPRASGPQPAAGAPPAPADETPEQRALRIARNTVAEGGGVTPEEGLAVCAASGVDPESLPPFAVGTRGASYEVRQLQMLPEEEELVLSVSRDD
jgi:hypothetical protein